MSPFVILALVFALTVFAVVVFVAVVLGIHSEPRYQMTTAAQRPLAAMIRRFLGVYVAKPVGDADAVDREECLTRDSAEWWNTGGWGQ